MDAVEPPAAGSPARTIRAVVIALSAAVVTVALGVVTGVLMFGSPGGDGRSMETVSPPIRTSGGAAPPTEQSTRTSRPTSTPTSTPPSPTADQSDATTAEPRPRVTVLVREPATVSADTVLGAIASMGTLLAGLGTLLAAVAALRTTRTATAGRQRKRSKKRR